MNRFLLKACVLANYFSAYHLNTCLHVQKHEHVTISIRVLLFFFFYSDVILFGIQKRCHLENCVSIFSKPQRCTGFVQKQKETNKLKIKKQNEMDKKKQRKENRHYKDNFILSDQNPGMFQALAAVMSLIFDTMDIVIIVYIYKQTFQAKI